MINALNDEIPNDISLSEKMYWLANDLSDFPKCKVCGKDIHAFVGQNYGYNTFCSCKCAQLSLETRQRFKETCLKIYGTENPAQSKVVQKKYINTCLDKYGAINAFASNYGKQKIKETIHTRYGVDNPQQNEKIKQKTKKKHSNTEI